MRFLGFPDVKPIQLKGTGGENPTWAAGGTLDFKMDNLPALRWGDHVEKNLGIMVTFSGVATLSGTTGALTARQMDVLKMQLIDHLEVSGAWDGSPVNAETFVGRHLGVFEWLSLGGRKISSEDVPLDHTSLAGQDFQCNVWVPLSDLRGKKGHHSAKPNVCYLGATLRIKCAAANTVVDVAGHHMAITLCTVRASAMCIAEREIVVGQAQDFLLLESTAATGRLLTLDNLADQAAPAGTAPDCALTDLLLMCDYGEAAVGSGGDDFGIETGSFTADTLITLSAPFLGIDETDHIHPFVSLAESMNDRQAAQMNLLETLATPSYGVRRSGIPWGLNAGRVRGDRTGLMFVPLLMAGPDLEITKCPRIKGTQTVSRRATVVGDNDQTIAHRIHRWNEAAKADLKAILIRTGVVRAVMGTEDVDWEPLVHTKPTSAYKAEYLPMRLAPVSKADVAGR